MWNHIARIIVNNGPLPGFALLYPSLEVGKLLHADFVYSNANLSHLVSVVKYILFTFYNVP